MACQEAAKRKLNEASDALDKIKKLENLNIHNIFKLKRRIIAEVKFLEKVRFIKHKH